MFGEIQPNVEICRKHYKWLKELEQELISEGIAVMAFVRINSGPISATDKLREVPKEKWRDLMVARRLHMKTKLAYDCRCLVEFVDDAEQMHEVLGYSSAEAMVREGYDLKPEEIDVAIRWLKLNPPKEAISFAAVKKLSGWGTNRRSER